VALRRKRLRAWFDSPHPLQRRAPGVEPPLLCWRSAV